MPLYLMPPSAQGMRLLSVHVMLYIACIKHRATHYRRLHLYAESLTYSCMHLALSHIHACILQAALEKFESALETALQAEVSWCEEVFPDGAHFAVGVYQQTHRLFFLHMHIKPLCLTRKHLDSAAFYSNMLCTCTCN
jgi:hypothetical protein